MDENPITLSVIIPVASNDLSWKNLLPQLELLDKASFYYEVILAAHDSILIAANRALVDYSPKAGRAAQMNHTAQHAKGQWFWFLHADSRVTEKGIKALIHAIEKNRQALYYFNLRFSKGGPPQMWTNSLGVYFRSHVLLCPFGDQGFLIQRDNFYECGMYDETADYGEDHLLVWQARQRKLPIKSLGASLFTSPRKYHERGWKDTTSLHMKLWFRQAWAQYKLLKQQ